MTALELCRQADGCLLSVSDAETSGPRSHHAAPRELSFVEEGRGGGGLIKGGLIQLSLKGFQAKRWDGALILREGQMAKELQSGLSGLILVVARDGSNPTGGIIITAFIAARH